MANINTELEQIRKAVYGREVRSSIANAIELINKEQISTSTAQTNLDSKFNQLIINAGNSNAEIVASRVKADGTQFDTLGKRLDKGDELHNALNNEVISARTDSKSFTYKNLKARLDKLESQLDSSIQQFNNGLQHQTNKGCVVSFIFDDARATVYNNALPIFKQYDKKASIALIVENLEKQINLSMTPNEVFNLINEGWDMMCHGYKSTKLTDDLDMTIVEREITNAKRLANKYGVELNGYVAPYGVTPAKFLPLVKQNFKYAYCNYESGAIDYKKDIHSLNRYSLDNKTFSSVKTVIDKAYNENSFLTLYAHEVNSVDLIKEIIEYCNNLNVPIMTVKDAIEYYFDIREKNIVFPQSEVEYPIIHTDKSLLWSYTTGSATNCTLTPYFNLQPFLKLSWNNAPYGSYYAIWKDFSMDTSINNIYGEVKIPFVCESSRVKVEIRIELFKDTTSKGMINVASINNNFTKKDLLGAKFFIPKSFDCNKLRIRIQPVNDFEGNTAELFIYTPILKIYSN